MYVHYYKYSAIDSTLKYNISSINIFNKLKV